MKKEEFKKLVKEVIQEENPSEGFMVGRWIKNEHLQNFLRQAHTDMYVGLKNGASDKEVARVVDEFLKHLKGYMTPKRM